MAKPRISEAKVSDESIRPMTDEERQRAKERSDVNKEPVPKAHGSDEECNDVNKECNDVGTISIQEVLEHEDGSATYTFNMDERAHKKLAELGLELAMTCVAYDIYIQEAMGHIRWLGVSKEVNDEFEGNEND